MKDRRLKELLFQHQWAQRNFAQPEVDVYYRDGVDGNLKLITDVDVLILRPRSDLRFDRVLGDCRTLKQQSPIGRALWLRGLIDFLGGSDGIILLDLPKIEPDHKLAAYSVGVLLMSEKDFGVYDRAVLYPSGTHGVGVSIADIEGLAGIKTRFPALEPLTRYAYNTAFQERSAGAVIRHTIRTLRLVSAELDPAKVEHRALVCDVAAIMAIGIAETTGRIFHQYLHPEEKALLSEALKLLVWGGKEQYQFFNSVREKLVKTDRDSHGDASLELPEWNSFVQLIRNLLERPSDALIIPWLLRQYAVCVLRSAPLAQYTSSNDLLAVKFSMLVLEYTVKAAGLPHEFLDRLSGPLVKLQTEITLRRSDEIKKSQSSRDNLAGPKGLFSIP